MDAEPGSAWQSHMGTVQLSSIDGAMRSSEGPVEPISRNCRQCGVNRVPDCGKRARYFNNVGFCAYLNEHRIFYATTDYFFGAIMSPPNEHLSIGQFRILTLNSEVGPYVERVQKNADSERNSFGFLNPNAYRQAAAQGKLFVAIDSDQQLVAHLMFGGVYPFGKVFQIYCLPEFRMSGIAAALMETLIEHFSKLGFLISPNLAF